MMDKKKKKLETKKEISISANPRGSVLHVLLKLGQEIKLCRQSSLAHLRSGSLNYRGCEKPGASSRNHAKPMGLWRVLKIPNNPHDQLIIYNRIQKSWHNDGVSITIEWWYIMKSPVFFQYWDPRSLQAVVPICEMRAHTTCQCGN